VGWAVAAWGWTCLLSVDHLTDLLGLGCRHGRGRRCGGRGGLVSRTLLERSDEGVLLGLVLSDGGRDELDEEGRDELGAA
jgi:hypothetical protein